MWKKCCKTFYTKALQLVVLHLIWCCSNTRMKVRNSSSISAYGGLNFVFEYMDLLGVGALLDKHLPSVAQQSRYSWRDIFYSFLSIYYSGGECIEDVGLYLKHHLADNPMVGVPSPDTILRRLASLEEGVQQTTTPKGVAEHSFCRNAKMEALILQMLKLMKAFDCPVNTLDYDNTILFNEKEDSRMTYKRNPGYQPGVCLLNEQHVLYIENRGGNSDAKSFQDHTLAHVFGLLEKAGIRKIDRFRADAASYQYSVISLLQEKVTHFYVGCRNSYVEKYYAQVKHWQDVQDEHVSYQVGEIHIKPFGLQARKQKRKPDTFRLIVKRQAAADGQMNVFTQDAYVYHSIMTNCFEGTAQECARYYDRRGNAERQFDIMKNDFGWDNLPFSTMSKNQVFMCFAALCRNLFNLIIRHFAEKIPHLRANFRLKKFIFRFIIQPAKWIKQARSHVLRLYGPAFYST